MKQFLNIENLRASAPTIISIVVATAIGVMAYADIRSRIDKLEIGTKDRFTATDYGFATLLHNSSPDKSLPSLRDIRQMQQGEN